MAILSFVKAEVPINKGLTVTKGNELGGIRLTYCEKANKTQQEHVFLKPFKEIWAISKKDCNKGEWGNSRSPYTTVWLELTSYSNYKDYSKDYMNIRYTIVTDHLIIKALNDKSSIILTGKYNIRTIPFIEYVRWFFTSLFSFKSKKS